MEFERALAFVLRWEGGYSDHPDDPGGATNYGITQATYDVWRRSNGLPTRPVREISMDEVRAIYRTRYWEPIRGDELPPPLALATFDLAVNSGVGLARKALREAGGDWRRLIAWRIEFLTSLPHWATFGKGWMRRVGALIQECAKYDTTLSAVRRIIVNGGPVARIKKATIVGDKLYVLTKEDGKA